jgi:hypothetical protein
MGAFINGCIFVRLVDFRWTSCCGCDEDSCYNLPPLCPLLPPRLSSVIPQIIVSILVEYDPRIMRLAKTIWSCRTLSTQPYLNSINSHKYSPSVLPLSVLGSSPNLNNMDFSLGDFCSTCDHQSNGSAFCSSPCRNKQVHHTTLADSTTTMTLYDETDTHTVSYPLNLSVLMVGFCLRLAYDFSVYRTSPHKPICLSMTSQATTAQHCDVGVSWPLLRRSQRHDL